jgi:SAM-dependent methyltransferase
VKLPSGFPEIVAEIARFTDLERVDIERRVWMQAVEPGWNVAQDAVRFQVTPHEYNEHMEQLYRDGDGYIFESLVFWARPGRAKWAKHSQERIESFAQANRREKEDIRILILGDGVGNESLYLADSGYCVDYFDVPASKTFDFAIKRFDFYGFLGTSIRPVTDYEQCLAQKYDVIICFEVLEHLPDAVQAIHDISTMLKMNGIALVTEDFDDVVKQHPTHLKTNVRFAGSTPFLFLEQGMLLTWYSHEMLFKPYEFTKVGRVSRRQTLALLADGNIRGPYLARYLSPLSRKLEKLAYVRLRYDR